MYKNNNNIASFMLKIWMWVVAGSLMMYGAPAYANHTSVGGAGTHAETPIGNQASATFTDPSGITKLVTSNVVTTTVAQVDAFTLTADQTKSVSIGGSLVFPHTLTNTGNGSTNFVNAGINGLTVLNIGGDDGDFSSITIYIDTTPDGVPDASELLLPNDPRLQNILSGGVVKILVVASVPSSIAPPPAKSVKLTLTADSTPPTGVAHDTIKTNTDIANVINEAIVNLTKSINDLNGPAQNGVAKTQYTYTLEYSNAGNKTAFATVITDVLPAGFDYVLGSGKWFGPVAGEVLTDTSGLSDEGLLATAAGVHYESSGGTVKITIDSLVPGASGKVSVGVTIDDPTTTAPLVLSNTATMAYDNDGISGGGTNASGSSNTVNFDVLMVSGVSVVGDTYGDNLPGSEPAPSAGGIVSFSNTITNEGAGIDTFEMLLPPLNGLASTFPVGTVFELYRADGVTPLTNTGGLSSLDTGPVAAGASVTVVLKAFLPAGVPGGGPYTVQKSATSQDGLSTATMTDTLMLILADMVDLANNTTTGPGSGIAAAIGARSDAGGAPWVTTSVNPGSVVTFTLTVRNAQGITNDYLLTAAGDGDPGADADFPPLPITYPGIVNGTGTLVCSNGGVTHDDCFIVAFKDASGALVMASTGPIGPGAFKTFNAEVTIPKNYPPGDVDIYFRAKSIITGSQGVDEKHDRITVNTVRKLVLESNNAGTITAGGFKVFEHNLTNDGNVVETGVTLATSGNANGFTSVIYVDNTLGLPGTIGVWDAGDTQIMEAGVMPDVLVNGGTVKIFVKVIAPPSASSPMTNVTTLTADPLDLINSVGPGGATAGVYTNADTVTLLDASLSVVKEQAVDQLCDGSIQIAYTASTIAAIGASGARPGDCILYRITVTNLGSSVATKVFIQDMTPVNTKMHVAAAIASQIGTSPAMTVITQPAIGGTGAIATGPAVTGVDLGSAGVVVMTFGVKID